MSGVLSAPEETERGRFLLAARQALMGPVASIAITLAAVIIIGLIAVGPRFLSPSNLAIIGTFTAVPLIVGAFSGFALLAGVVDLSIGSMVGLGSAVFAALLVAGWNVWPAAGATLSICAGFGILNAAAIVTFRADPIAATLGTLVALRGLTQLVVSAAGASGSISAFDPGLFIFTNSRFLFLPQIFVIALCVVAVATVVVTRTRIGRHVQAVGGDHVAARRAGIAVGRVRYAVLTLSAVGAGIGGIVLVGLLGSASSLTGTGLEFEVYAALMIGGYSILRGGVGNPVGGALGLLAVAGLSNILDLTGPSPYYVNIIVGLLLLAAVFLDRLRGGDAYK